jgi:hypothetical protein
LPSSLVLFLKSTLLNPEVHLATIWVFCQDTFAHLPNCRVHITTSASQVSNSTMLFDYFAKLPSPLNVWIAHCLNSILQIANFIPEKSSPTLQKQAIKWDGCMLNNAKALAVDLEVAKSGLCNNLGGNLLCSLIGLTQLEFLSPSWHRYMEYPKVNLC